WEAGNTDHHVFQICSSAAFGLASSPVSLKPSRPRDRTVINKSRRSRTRSAIRKVRRRLPLAIAAERPQPLPEAEPALNSRSAKRHRASQFGGAKSISALASDRETREKYKFFFAPARTIPVRIVDCNQSVVLLSRGSRNIPKRDRNATCAQRRRQFLF